MSDIFRGKDSAWKDDPFRHRVDSSLSVIKEQDSIISQFHIQFARVNEYIELIRKHKLEGVDSVKKLVTELTNCKAATASGEITEEKLMSELISHNRRIRGIEEELKSHIRSVETVEHVMSNVIKMHAGSMRGIFDGVRKSILNAYDDDKRFVEGCVVLGDALVDFAKLFEMESKNIKLFEERAIEHLLKNKFGTTDIFYILTYAGQVASDSLGFSTVEKGLSEAEGKDKERLSESVRMIVEMTLSHYDFNERFGNSMQEWRDRIYQRLMADRDVRKQKKLLDDELRSFSKYQVGYRCMDFAKSIAGPFGIPVIKDVASVLDAKKTATTIVDSFLQLLVDLYDDVHKASNYDAEKDLGKFAKLVK